MYHQCMVHLPHVENRCSMLGVPNLFTPAPLKSCSDLAPPTIYNQQIGFKHLGSHSNFLICKQNQIYGQESMTQIDI